MAILFPMLMSYKTAASWFNPNVCQNSSILATAVVEVAPLETGMGEIYVRITV